MLGTATYRGAHLGAKSFVLSFVTQRDDIVLAMADATGFVEISFGVRGPDR